MSKFKIGDKVKLKNGFAGFQGGSEFDVICLNDPCLSTRGVWIIKGKCGVSPDNKLVSGKVDINNYASEFEFADVSNENREDIDHDPVNKPSHYQLTESLEVKDLMKILLNRIEQSDIGFSHFQSSCYKEAMQYLLRFMLKNGYEDLAKAQVYLTEVIENKDK